MLEYGRVDVLPEISDRFDALKADVENTVDVTVTSATELSSAQVTEIESALKSRLGRDVILSTVIDENLIGGAVIRAGDVVIFAEATIHGTLPWRAEHQRRTLIYPYAPRYQARVSSIYEVSYPSYVQDMTSEQQTVLRPPGLA
mgnify:CR=1 FL=1